MSRGSCISTSPPSSRPISPLASSSSEAWPSFFPRRARWDRLARASAEVGLLFTGLTLVSGSIWGKPTWGTWWTWDARLTSTAILFLIYVGYLLLRGMVDDQERGARYAAVVGSLGAVNMPIGHFSLPWWGTLRAGRASPGRPSPK